MFRDQQRVGNRVRDLHVWEERLRQGARDVLVAARQAAHGALPGARQHRIDLDAGGEKHRLEAPDTAAEGERRDHPHLWRRAHRLHQAERAAGAMLHEGLGEPV
ncbi:MAG: hypothetical protein OEV65_17380 [Aquincola sp.]|nr:hypothetical protein [Aquincola sp.]